MMSLIDYFANPLLVLYRLFEKLAISFGFSPSILKLKDSQAKPPTASASPSYPPSLSTPFPSDSPLGLDCEMVGVGSNGRVSQLARVTLVRSLVAEPTRLPHFEVVYDVIVKPQKKVTDFRTKYSGINKEILRSGLPSVPLVSFSEARAKVGKLISGRVVVGHSAYSYAVRSFAAEAQGFRSRSP